MLSICLWTGVAQAQNNATGVISTEINYRWTDTSQYIIRFKVVYDCSMGPGFTFSYLDVDNHRDSDTLKTDTSFQIHSSAFTLVSSTDVTPVMASCPMQSKCGGMLPFGWKELIYEAPLHLDSFENCLWTVSYTACCRNAYLTTVSANQPHYNFCEINQCVQNSSFHFKEPFPFIAIHNRDFHFSPFPQDLDSDADSFSLHYVSPLRGHNSPLAFQSPHSANRPLDFFGFPNPNLALPAGFHVNGQSGDIEFRPTKIHDAGVLSIEIVEWRNTDSVMRPIGKTRKDFILAVDTVNKPRDPKISASSLFSQELCPNDTFRFSFAATPETGIPCYIDHQGAIPSMQLDYSIGQNQEKRLDLTWVPQVTDQGLHLLRFNVWDSVCPFQSRISKTLVLHVRDSMAKQGPHAGSDKTLTYAPQLNLQGNFNLNNTYPVTWRSNGDGYFTSDSSLNTVYFLGPQDSASACSLQFYLSVDKVPGCFVMKKSDTTQVYFQAPKPEIVLIGQTADVDSVMFSVLNSRNLPFSVQHNGQGSLSPDLASASFLYFPSTAERNTGATILFTVEINRCGTSDDTLTADIYALRLLPGKGLRSSVFPNPFCDELYVSLATPMKGNITLHSVDGKVVSKTAVELSEKAVKIDTTALPPGIYLVKIPGAEVVKVIKEN